MEKLSLDDMHAAMTEYVQEIHIETFCLQEWHKIMEENCDDKRQALNAFITNVYEKILPEILEIYAMPCFEIESFRNMYLLFDVPTLPEHRALMKVHRKFIRKWTNFKERISGTQKNRKKAKARDDSAGSVDSVPGS